MTNNNPCSPGWRVPTNAEWIGVVNTIQNKQPNIGTNWSSEATNYTTGRKFGELLFLPTAGYRNSEDGQLYFRGSLGSYWSSTRSTSLGAYDLRMDSSEGYTEHAAYRPYGFSVRCIAE